MKEFGSDFHYIETFSPGCSSLSILFPGYILLADGRQCIVTLLRQNAWKRIWIPEYFCREVVETIKVQTGIDVVFYSDSPLNEAPVEELPVQDGDVLFRVNFFGSRGIRSNRRLSCPVIEDHTHDLLGEWALNSDADWCISSLRKLLPIPEGGMVWSPKGHQLTYALDYSEDNEQIATIRWEGMRLKTAFLSGENICKEAFRKHFTETERWFDKAEPSIIDGRSCDFVSEKLDIRLWQAARRRNWTLLKEIINRAPCRILEPESEACTMFSLVLLLDSKEHRDIVNKRLISSSVYPAILWNLPDGVSSEAMTFSDCMLSIHCDGRYSEDEIIQLAALINKSLQTNNDKII